MGRLESVAGVTASHRLRASNDMSCFQKVKTMQSFQHPIASITEGLW